MQESPWARESIKRADELEWLPLRSPPASLATLTLVRLKGETSFGVGLTQDAESWGPVVVNFVAPGSAAERGGLVEGDEVLRLGGLLRTEDTSLAQDFLPLLKSQTAVSIAVERRRRRRRRQRLVQEQASSSSHRAHGVRRQSGDDNNDHGQDISLDATLLHVEHDGLAGDSTEGEEEVEEEVEDEVEDEVEEEAEVFSSLCEFSPCFDEATPCYGSRDAFICACKTN
jgi:hypothetical protein